MIDGETVGLMEDFSPEQSSISSLPRSHASLDEQETQRKEVVNFEDVSVAISRSQTSEASSTVQSAMFSSTSISSESSYSSKSRSFWNKMVKSPNTKILYDEMLT